MLVLTAPHLVPLLKCVTGIGPVVAGKNLRIDGLPVKWAPLMSVPAALHLTPGTIPNVPYIAAEPERVVRWTERIGSHGFKIELVWQGNPAHARDKHRSIALAELASLAEIAGARLISLQKQPGSAEIAAVPFCNRIETFADAADTSPQSLLDTAAMMMALDLIITVDTMAAHLAGALGRPVWLALDAVPDWRWLLDHDDSPWYPTARLFRQDDTRAWDSVIVRVHEALLKLVKGPQ